MNKKIILFFILLLVTILIKPITALDTCSSDDDCTTGLCCEDYCRDPSEGICDDVDRDGIPDTWVPIGTTTTSVTSTTTSTSTTTTSTTTSTSTPTTIWEPSGEIKTDPKLSNFTIDPYMVGVNQTAIIKINLVDKDGNPVTNEVPYLTVTGGGNTIIQPTIGVNSLAYFSSTVSELKWITVKVGNKNIGMRSIKIQTTPQGFPIQNMDISLANPPKDKLRISTHGQPIYFHVPKGRHVDKVTVIVDCGENNTKTIPLTLYSQNGGQVFQGIYYGKTQRGLKCTLRITMEPSDEPPIEIPIEPIDPYGTIYDAETGKEIEGALTTLYELQESNWIIWNGTELEQVNPQITDESGFYSFMVYPGKYYLSVEKEEYEPFKSDTIEVIEDPINLDVYLNSESKSKDVSPHINYSKYVIIALSILVFVIGVYRVKKR